MSLSKRIARRTRAVLKEQLPSVLAGLGMLLAVYCLSLLVPANWITYVVGAPACVILLITALARLNDIQPEQNSTRWQVRRLGFILAGTGAVTFLTCPFTQPVLFPSWKAVILLWGVAMTWITTPGMPPWWKYINGDFKREDIRQP